MEILSRYPFLSERETYNSSNRDNNVIGTIGVGLLIWLVSTPSRLLGFLYPNLDDLIRLNFERDGDLKVNTPA